MKRRYKLILIITVGAILTLLVNTITVDNKIMLVSIGDGLSLGMTPYKVAGTSFNDYLKEELESKKKLQGYNNEFSQSYLTIHELNEYIEDNLVGKFTRVPIKQTLAKADVITISIGIDEFAQKSLQNTINNEQIESYINEMKLLLKSIREFYDKKIIIIGLYPAYNFEKKDVIEVNNKLKKEAGKYNCLFYDIYPFYLNNSYFLTNTSYYINYLAHQKIASDLLKMLL